MLTARDIHSLKIAQFVHKQLCSDQSNAFTHYFKTVAHDCYPNTRRRFKLLIPRAKTLVGDRMIKLSGAQIWNTLTEALKQDLRGTSKFKLHKLVKNYYLNKYTA